ncbi:MAG: aminomethyltransferase beta-barrel domain-containing protein, partial [Rikenellaceae bacterium]
AIFISNEETHWINPTFRLGVGEQRRFSLRIRYRQPLQWATLHRSEAGVYIVFDEAQRSVAAGQFAAWYNDDELVGSGVISS